MSTIQQEKHLPAPADNSDTQNLKTRIKSLEQENALLKQILKENGIQFPNKATVSIPAMRRLSAQEKIILFASLFRGRTDVFARRWYSTSTGKSGYQPVCRNEWAVGLCDKKSRNVLTVRIASLNS